MEINAVINYLDGMAIIMLCPKIEYKWRDIRIYNRFRGIGIKVP
jgi:hypothetical protein